MGNDRPGLMMMMEVVMIKHVKAAANSPPRPITSCFHTHNDCESNTGPGKRREAKNKNKKEQGPRSLS
jgi:hypothetical protein